jgi:TolB-like protein/Tfp pilus assembly protein PilF
MPASFIQELKRRNVFRVAAIYVIVSWLLMQIGDVMFPALLLPEWSTRLLVAFLILGLPLALIFAWAYEITPEGVKRTIDVDPGTSVTDVTGRKINFVIIAVLAVAVVFLVGKIWLTDDNVPHTAAAVNDKSIAVLPFDNRSATPEDAEFFAAGLHDELLTLLSKLGDLRVISRTSVERLDRDLSIPEIGALLGVATVLEGGIQRAGNRLRINMQLIDATREDHLWATTYDRELTAENVFDVQSDIARTIAKELNVQLSISDETYLNSIPTANTDALNQYLVGRQVMKLGTFESTSQATRHFREATALDPGYAQAWAAVANALHLELATGLISRQEYVRAAEPAVTRAMQLDDQLPAAHAQLANLRWQSGDLEAAESSFKTALQLNPGDPRSLYEYGTYLRTTGQPVAAIPIFERALEDDPLSIDILFQLGRAEMYAGNPGENEVYAQRILEIDPSSVSGYAGHVQANLWTGRYDLMWPWFMRFFDVDPQDFENWAHMGLYAEQLGAIELSDRYMDEALQLGAEEPAVLKCNAQVLALRGKNEEALVVARRALEGGLDDRWFSNRVFLRLVRDDALKTGDFDNAREWYRNLHPALFLAMPEITVDNVNSAADLALLLQRSGDPDTADTLINAGLSWYRRTQPANAHGYVIDIVDVQFLALQGETAAALQTLQRAADRGWGFLWQWNTSNENLSSIRDEPQFQAITAQLEKGMVAQLEAVRALPDMGEYDLRVTRIE